MSLEYQTKYEHKNPQKPGHLYLCVCNKIALEASSQEDINETNNITMNEESLLEVRSAFPFRTTPSGHLKVGPDQVCIDSLSFWDKLLLVIVNW